MRWRTLVALLLVCPAAAGAAPPLSHDVNGDGLADVGIAEPEGCGPDQAAVIFGSRDRAERPSWDAPGARGFVMKAESCVERAEIIGDVNGDGLADVLTGGDGSPSLSVVYGKRGTGPVSLIGLARRGGGAEPRGDDTIAHGAGDVNGDGLADVIFSTGNGRHVAKVYLGGRGTPFKRSFLVLGAGRLRVGIRGELGGVGDVNGDGIGDFALAVQDPDGRVDGFDVEDLVFVVWGARGHHDVILSVDRRGHARVTRAGCSRPCRSAGVVLRHGHDCFCEVYGFYPLGDLNGDGRDEMGVVYDSRTDILFGRRTAGTVTLPGPGGTVVRHTSFVEPVLTMGDVTGDGVNDALVGNSNESQLRALSGKRLLRNVHATFSTDLVLRAPGTGFGTSAGDFDGDGHDDILLQWGADIDKQHWSIVYGASPFEPLDLRAATPQQTTRITGDGYPDEPAR